MTSSEGLRTMDGVPFLRSPDETFEGLADAGHFPQETHGAEIARLVLGYAGAART